LQVLVVEDDVHIAEELALGLNDHGFHVVQAGTGRTAIDRCAEVDVVLLDLGLPDLDGIDVCRMIRKVCEVPIIIVTARGAEFDRVLGLKMGADDYVVKPYGLRELAARVEVVSRRKTVPRQAEPDEGIRDAGPVRVDLRQRRVIVEDREVVLTRKEFDLLALLTDEPGRVFTRELIMSEIWGYDDVIDSRTLGVHMTSLRKKLGLPRLIETVRGVGFRVCA
jgi:two-component system response regulator RegX3